MNKTRKWLAIGGVVLLVVVSVIGFVASRGSKNNTSTNKAPSGSGSSSTAKKSTALHTPNEALSLVRTTFLQASAYKTRTSNADQGEIDAIKNYISGDLYSQLTQTLQVNLTTGDQIICHDIGANTGYSVNFVGYDGTSATVAVTENYDTPVKVLYTVDLSSLKITNIVCPY